MHQPLFACEREKNEEHVLYVISEAYANGAFAEAANAVYAPHKKKAQVTRLTASHLGFLCPPQGSLRWDKAEKNYLWIRPVPLPPARAFTSSTLTILKSPSMECFRQEAATANSTAS